MTETPTSIPSKPKYSAKETPKESMESTEITIPIISAVDVKEWEDLIKSYQTKYDKDHNKETAAALFQTYQTLLKQSPYLEEHWKAYLILEFKVNGIEKSIAVLENSVKAYPYSVDLWTDYLTAVISQWPDNVEKVRTTYSEAITLNGLHFTSHTIWDKIIEYESSIEVKSDILLHTYKRLVQIPLYQYAQYYKQFTDMKYTAEQIIDGDLRGKTDQEKNQLLEEYNYATFLKTQTDVNAKWEFESSLQLENSIDVWKSYLDFEISKQGNFDQVVNLFERCLVPNCFSVRIWLKYISYVNGEDNFELTKDVYTKAGKFLPLTENTLRFTYPKFLMKYNKFNQAIEYFIEMLNVFQGKFKKEYLETVEELSKFLGRTIQEDFDHFVLSIMEPKNKKQKLELSEKKFKLPQIINTLTFSDEAKSILVRYYLRNQFDKPTIRTVFNNHSGDSWFRKSAQLWRFFLEYEAPQNYSNFLVVLQDLKQKSELPKFIYDALIDLSYDLALANFAVGNIDNSILLTRDNDISNSIVENFASAKRLAGQNYLVLDLKQSKEESFLKVLSSHVAHPGIVVEATPEVTNTLIGNWMDLDGEVAVPAFPTFRNVEKASLGVVYPK